MPAETSDTARPRCVVNQPVTVAIIGAKNAATAPPALRPKLSWKVVSVGARPASQRLSAKSAAPARTTGRAPKRSDRAPQIIEVTAIARKPMVIAIEMPVRDQPVASAIGVRSTGNEKSDP